VTGQQSLDVGVTRSAVISADGVYRYRLERRWTSGPTVAWIMLNPSTADADTDDPTLRRISVFSRAWGFGRLIVANLYALRATDPAQLWTAPDAVGPDNDRHVADAVSCHEVIVAWGANAKPDYDGDAVSVKTLAAALRHVIVEKKAAGNLGYVLDNLARDAEQLKEAVERARKGIAGGTS